MSNFQEGKGRKKSRVKLIGERLKSIREKAKIGQKELALDLGMGKMTVYYYEHEKTDAKISHVIDIAIALNVSIDYLCGLTDDPRPLRRSDISDSEEKLLNAFRSDDMRTVHRILADKGDEGGTTKNNISSKPVINQN
jgi:transcriptional regulator with XRE-family HTH domain